MRFRCQCRTQPRPRYSFGAPRPPRGQPRLKLGLSKSRSFHPFRCQHCVRARVKEDLTIRPSVTYAIRGLCDASEETNGGSGRESFWLGEMVILWKGLVAAGQYPSCERVTVSRFEKPSRPLGPYDRDLVQDGKDISNIGAARSRVISVPLFVFGIWDFEFAQKMTTQSRPDGTAHGEPVEPSSGGVGVSSFSFLRGWRPAMAIA